MKYYYDITIVNGRTSKDVPVCLDSYYDTSKGDNRVAVVDLATIQGDIMSEEVQFIVEVENMTESEYNELVEYNKNRNEKA